MTRLVFEIAKRENPGARWESVNNFAWEATQMMLEQWCEA